MLKEQRQCFYRLQASATRSPSRVLLHQKQQRNIRKPRAVRGFKPWRSIRSSSSSPEKKHAVGALPLLRKEAGRACVGGLSRTRISERERTGALTKKKWGTTRASPAESEWKNKQPRWRRHRAPRTFLTAAIFTALEQNRRSACSKFLTFL